MTEERRRQSDVIEERIDEVLVEVRKLHRAFPQVDGEVDVEGHRKYHEAKIKAAEAEALFWQELKIDIVKKGVWGLLIIMTGLLITGIAVKFGINAPAHLH